MRRKSVIGHLVFIYTFLALVIYQTDFFVRVGNGLGIDLSPEITQGFSIMMKYHERIDPNVPKGAAIFIGDSLTQGLCVDAVFTPSVNYGIGSDTTHGVLKRIPKYKSLDRASIVIIEVGVNDLRRRNNEEILSNYSSILNLLPAHLPVIISGVLPVNEDLANNATSHNVRIRELNSRLETLCESRKPLCTFVDSGRSLMDSSGNLSNRYQDGDGLHLNGEGNGVWIQELKNGIETAQQRCAFDRKSAPAAK